MKFAIYGDSFAESSFHLDRRPQLDSAAWTTLLALRLGATSIDYHALGGSSFFYSHQQMLATADGYDRSIIAVSEPDRYTKSIAGHRFTSPPPDHAQYPGVSSLTLRNLMGWFASLDHDFMDTAQELMIRDIESRWPNTVIVPSFSNSFIPTRAAAWHNFSLLDINQRALQQLRLRGNQTAREIHSTTGIVCHMPLEWHGAVAHLIYNFLQTGHIVIPRLRLAHGRSSYYSGS